MLGKSRALLARLAYVFGLDPGDTDRRVLEFARSRAQRTVAVFQDVLDEVVGHFATTGELPGAVYQETAP
jgi:hypothetical protein